MKHSIATIISYCTNDYKFLKPCIKQVSQFSQQIIIPYCDHFYDNTPENPALIKKGIKENPQAQFISFPYDPYRTITIWRGWAWLFAKLGLGDCFGPRYWVVFSKLVGAYQVNKNINYVLFLDIDEIIDAKKFKAWLNTKAYQKFNAMKFANYCYFRNPKYQSTTYENSAVMIKRTLMDPKTIVTNDARNATYRGAPGRKKRMILGLDNQPMIHHYGWAKPKKNLLKKVKTWGHSKDRNWKKLIEKEFSRPFTGTDFIYQRQYKTVKPFI